MADVLLSVIGIAVIFCAYLAVRPLAVGLLQRVAAFFAVPVPPPPGLARISAIIEQRQAEQRAAAAARQRREPLPEIVVALRAITGNGRR